jgi:hypothetical protein
MSHELLQGLSWEKRFNTSAGLVSERELVEELLRVAPEFDGTKLKGLRRRIHEDPYLLWSLIQEAPQRFDVKNKAGWINRSYMREKGLGRFA